MPDTTTLAAALVRDFVDEGLLRPESAVREYRDAAGPRHWRLDLYEVAAGKWVPPLRFYLYETDGSIWLFDPDFSDAPLLLGTSRITWMLGLTVQLRGLLGPTKPLTALSAQEEAP